MNTARSARIPVDHVVAEVAAFPLASECSLRLALRELDPMLREPAGELWRGAEGFILGSFPGFSVDEAVTLRDRLWFGERYHAGGVLPLAAYLRGLARLFLRVEGDTAYPLIPDEEDLRWRGPALTGPLEAHARLAWRWLSFALPPDLLLGARSHPPPRRIELVSPTVHQMLNDGHYAETHVHLGCTMDFPALWVIALHAMGSKAWECTSTLESPGGVLRGGRDLAPWLLSAGIARQVLAAYLYRVRSSGRAPPPPFRQFFGDVVAGKVFAKLRPPYDTLLMECLSELLRGRLSDVSTTFRRRQELYRQLAGVTAGVPGKTPDEVQRNDPAGPYFQDDRGGATTEVQFTSHGLALLEGAGRPEADLTFATLFWQVVRLRSLFYRHVVQRPLTPGLQWFIRFYTRMKQVSGSLPKRLLVEFAAERAGRGSGLTSLEVRTSPDRQRHKILREVKDVVEASERLQRTEGADRRATGNARPRGGGEDVRGKNDGQEPPLEFGLVFHFARDRGGNAAAGLPIPHWHRSHCDPQSSAHQRGDASSGEWLSGNPTGYRYARFYNKKREEAAAFGWLLHTFPLTLEVVRGIDLCTDELGVPGWVFLPLIKRIRAAGERASAFLRRNCGRDVKPLRLTVHCGEDFVHLLTGLRNLGEIGRYFDLRQGARVGHGLALGVDPQDWARRAGRIPILCEVRLFDLAWEWAWYATEGGSWSSNRKHQLERELTRLSAEIFSGLDGGPPSPYELEILSNDLYTPLRLWEAGFPTGGAYPVDLSRRANLLRHYLKDVGVFQRGRKVEWVDPTSEGEVLAELQGGIRRKFGEYGIAVEVNPTSNLLIGDLQDLTKHPLWRLRPPQQKEGGRSVSVCIGSDDPLTFATTLREEYQFLHDALTLAGLSDEDARSWLDRTRAAGLENRFTLRRSTDKQVQRIRNLAPLPATVAGVPLPL